MIGSIDRISYNPFAAGTPGSRKGEESTAPNGKTNAEKKDELTAAEKEQVKKLKERDAHVRDHEMAHSAAAGGLAQGGPTYTYQTGPDGKNYAIGGSVKIDTSPGKTPEESIQKARQIRAASTAPSDPSGQDLQVAALASSMTIEAQGKLPEDSGDKSLREGYSKDKSDGSITSSRHLATMNETESNDPQSNSQNEKRQNPFARRAFALYESHSNPGRESSDPNFA